MPNKRGPKPPPPDDPDCYTRSLRGGRTDFDPDVLPCIMSFLLMLERRYNDAAARALARSGNANPRVALGVASRYRSIAEAVRVIAEDATRPWSRVDWLAAVASIQEARDSGWPGPLTDPPADPSA